MRKDYWLEGKYMDTLAIPIDYNDKGVQLYWARILASEIVRSKMTHDQLRDYIDKFDAAGMVNEPAVKALRAVVELHKPIEEDGKLWCEHEVCYNHIEFLERDDCDCSYPCPTIQAIEKELL